MVRVGRMWSWAIVGLAAAAAVMAAPASAQNRGWSGLYAGGQIAYGFGDSRATDAAGNTTGNFDIDGTLGGATLGYNLQAGSVVYGVETDFSFSDVGGSTTRNCPLGCLIDVDWLWTLRGRLGYDVGGIMPYVTAGLAVADADANIRAFASSSEIRTGYTVGGGIEVGLGSNWTIKGEYLYVDLGHIDVPLASPVKANLDNLNIVRFGVNYRF